MTGEKFNNLADLRAVLIDKKGDQFSRSLTEAMLTYAMGRGLEYYDKTTVNEVVARMKKGGYKFSRMIEGIVNSVPFQKRRGIPVK